MRIYVEMLNVVLNSIKESTTELQDCMQRTAASMRAAMVNRVNTDWEQRLAHLLEQAPMFRQAILS